MGIFHRKRQLIDSHIFADIDRFLAEQELPAAEECIVSENSFLYGAVPVFEDADHEPSDASLGNTGELYDADELKQYHAPSMSRPASGTGRKLNAFARKESASAASAPSGSLERMLANADDTFQQHLFKLIDARGLKDSYVYKRAEIDRRLFSKIRSNTYYKPKKLTVVSLCLALELNMDESADLLKRAGYALSESSRQDLIIRYCIEHEIYDRMTVNDILLHYDQPLLTKE